MNIFAPLLRALRRRLRTEERGFTIVELMVAQGIILVSLLSLAYTATVGFSDIALARQREGANGLANGVIEQVRALPFDVVKRGLSNSDATVATDPLIFNSGCGAGNTLCYRPIASAALEAIPRGDNAVTEPLNPHRATSTIRGTIYTRSVYVTYLNNDPTLNAFRVTVLVTWAAPQRGTSLATVQAQTVMYSPPGCTSTATHPFSSPCQPFLYASADRPQGAFTLTGTIQGVNFESATLFTTSQSSTMQIEQISAVQSRALSSGVKFVVPGGNAKEVIPVQASAQADNDPSQPGLEYESAQLVPMTQVCCAAAEGSQNFLQVVASTGDSGQVIATSRANGANTCQSQIDSMPCGLSSSSQGTLQHISLHLQRGGAADLGLTDIASIQPSGNATGATVDRTLPAGNDGSVSAQVNRRVGVVRLGALPTTFPTPAGWDRTISLVRLTNYADTASAAAGRGTSAPSSDITAGTLQYWNPATNGYTVVNLGTAASAAVPFTIPDFSFTGQVSNKTVRVEYAAISFRSGGFTTSETISGTARTRASASVLAPLAGEFRQRVFIEGSQVADLLFTIDLIATSASAQYVPAPGGAA